jgi:phosphoribosylglycinamide formyltransferase 1
LSELLNLVLDLDDRFANAGAARERIERAGFALDVAPGASDRTLAWIDEVFGGAWSSEVFAGDAAVATRDGAPAGFAAYDARGFNYAWLRGAAREPGVGVFGPFGVDPAHRGTELGSALLHIALCGLRAKGYTRALIAGTNEKLAAYYAKHTGAHIAERFDTRTFARPVRTVVLASGSGSNFQAVADAVAKGSLQLDLRALVTNRADAYALERARSAGVPSHIVSWQRGEETRATYDARLRHAIEEEVPELVLLLGWMHLLDPACVAAFPQMLNVHPAFLPLDPERDTVGLPDGSVIPAYRGAHAVRDALVSGSGWIGASIHQVTGQTDRGRIYARKPLRVAADEDQEAVLARLHPIEHELLIGAIRRWIFER